MSLQRKKYRLEFAIHLERSADLAQKSLFIVGMKAPIVFVCLVALVRTPKFGLYAKASTAFFTLRLVLSFAYSGVLRHREIGAVDTPAFFATSLSVEKNARLFLSSLGGK